MLKLIRGKTDLSLDLLSKEGRTCIKHYLQVKSYGDLTFLQKGFQFGNRVHRNIAELRLDSVGNHLSYLLSSLQFQCKGRQCLSYL